MDPLTRLWAMLIGLAVATTLLAGGDGGWTVILLLALAWAKALLILSGFLHLRAVPGWLATFMLPLALWLGLIGGLHVLVLR